MSRYRFIAHPTTRCIHEPGPGKRCHERARCIVTMFGRDRKLCSDHADELMAVIRDALMRDGKGKEAAEGYAAWRADLEEMKQVLG